MREALPQQERQFGTVRRIKNGISKVVLKLDGAATMFGHLPPRR